VEPDRLETRTFDPYGQPLASTGTPQTPFGFTGELADANGLLYLRARHYAPRLGAFPSLDPYEGSAARPMSLNGYSWVEWRVADGRDPSGRCSFNASSTYSQRNQCSDAINQYIRLIEQQYGPQMNWPSDLRALVAREWRYWNSISYSDFMREWNSSRPPASTNSSNGMGQDLVFAGGVAAMVDGPLLFGDAAAAILIIAGLCVAGLAALASSGAIALPMRQTYYFSDSLERVDEDEIAWPIPPTRDGSKVVLYRAIGPHELSFVRSVGFTNYGFSPNGSGKYFALTLAGVTQFAGADINDYAVFTITRIRVSAPIVLFGYFFNDIGQQGAGWSIHFSDEALVGLYLDLMASNERIVIIGAV
jgi:RHS repeat-associated protein